LRGTAAAVCSDELKQVMTIIGENCSDEELREMMLEADMDKNGQVDYEEFLKMVGPENDAAYMAQDAARVEKEKEAKAKAANDTGEVGAT